MFDNNWIIIGSPDKIYIYDCILITAHRLCYDINETQKIIYYVIVITEAQLLCISYFKMLCLKFCYNVINNKVQYTDHNATQIWVQTE